MFLPPNTRFKLLAALVATTFPALAFAYVGPGAGITAIGSVLALLGGIVLAIVGFIWYPVKRLFRALTGKPAKDASRNPVKPPGGEQDQP